ncbi:adenosylcobinamide-GDP ribazoletransferase, partial [Streptomyces sp. NPDC060028]|uniref:adenosylcobinamide-GDP ribazoletransferase n=1 Tax=Streptomyces sp. NPDC060028 TaxID=3347041 RepID=UPI0036D140AA
PSILRGPLIFLIPPGAGLWGAAPPLPLGLPAAGRQAAAVVAALLVAELLLRRCVRRFDGVTGDVFGALAEVSATTALVVLALG